MKHHLKRFQLYIHHHYREVVISVVVAIVIVVALGAGIMIANQNRLLAEVKALGQQNKNLILQNTALNKQEEKNTQRTQAHIDCVAKIFAQYTHDFIPITIANLDTCTVAAGPVAPQALNTPAANAPTSPQTPSSTPTSSSNNPPPANSPQSNNSPNPPNNPNNDKLLDCKIDILGVHVGCP